MPMRASPSSTPSTRTRRTCSTAGGSPEDDPDFPNLYGVFKSNFNTLMPHQCVGQLGFGAPYKSMVCEIRKVDSLDAEGLAVEDPLNISNTKGAGMVDGYFSTEERAV